jgi:hypothetical protein
MSRATALGALTENDNWKKRRSLISTERRKTDPNQCADKHLGTKFRERGNPLYLAICPQLIPLTTFDESKHPFLTKCDCVIGIRLMRPWHKQHNRGHRQCRSIFIEQDFQGKYQMPH